MSERVQINSSRAIRAAHRRARVTNMSWSVGRWFVRGMTAILFVSSLTSLLGIVGISPVVTGLLLIGAGGGLLALVVDFYLVHNWSVPPILPPLTNATQQQNLSDYLTTEATQLVMATDVSLQSEGAVWSIAQVLMATQGTPSAWFVQRLGLLLAVEDLQELRTQEGQTGEPTLGTLIEHAAEQVILDQRSMIDDLDIVLASLRVDQHAGTLLSSLGLSLSDAVATAAWLRDLRARLIEKPFWQEPAGSGIAQDWTSGYTPFLRNFTQDLTKLAETAGDRLFIQGRRSELTQFEQTISKNRGHNMLLVGRPGVGKQTLVLALAKRVAMGETVEGLRYQHLLQLDLNSVLSGVSDRGEIESRLLRVFSEAARAGNTILVIPDIHLLVGGGDRVAGVDATELLIQLFQSSAIRVIATTTPEELQGRIATQPSLIGLIERFDVPELESPDVIAILENSVFGHEKETGAFFTYPALKTVSEVAERYVKDQPMPESALNLLADVASFARTAEKKVVTPEIVRQVLSEKLQIPLDIAATGERDKLINLEEELHKTVVGQDEAIGILSTALRRARSGLTSGKRPIASLLFLGPTGVGKTETAKALARVYFGGEDRMVRFDMSEYSQPDSLVRLVGTPAANGTKVGGLLADAVHDRPFSLVLLDEFEKAHPQILNLFLQIFDDGRLTDGTGRLVDFTNTIMIATSNAGAEFIRQSIVANEDQATRQKNLLDHLQSQGIYKPELLNRFDGVVAFHPLAPDHVRSIVELMLHSLAAKLQTEQQITLTFAPDLVDALATAGFDPLFGARPIRRVIQDKVESALANMILAGQVQKGGSLVLSREQVGL